MAEMTADKNVKKEDHEFLSSKRVGCCKWFKKRSVTTLVSYVEQMSDNHIICSMKNNLIRILKFKVFDQVLSKCTNKT